MRSRPRSKFFLCDHFFAENPAGTAKNDPEMITTGAPRDWTYFIKVHQNFYIFIQFSLSVMHFDTQELRRFHRKNIHRPMHFLHRENLDIFSH